MRNVRAPAGTTGSTRLAFVSYSRSMPSSLDETDRPAYCPKNRSPKNRMGVVFAPQIRTNDPVIRSDRPFPAGRPVPRLVPGRGGDMCDHCGCREVTPIRRLMDEHERLLDLAGEIRDALRAGDPAAARARFAELTALLLPHVRAEERGLFSVMRERGEFTEHVDALEAEHGELEARIAAAPDDAALPEVLDRLQAHIYAENFGLFPAALAGLGGDEWAEVEAREGRTAAEPLAP
jgi:hypothetical protein